MNLQELDTLLDYHYWARDRILSATAKLTPDDFTRDLGSSFRSVRDTLVHVYAAEWIWCARWRGESPASMPQSGEFADVASLGRAWSELEVAMRDVLARYGREGTDTLIEYRDTRGTVFRQIYWKMLQHVVNHASYHRGQVTSMIRQLGAAPPESMDLITFYRHRDQL
jgi:uncharacterized damage-inducible protein DinB